MGFIITWLLIITILTFVLTILRPQFLNLLFPIERELKRVHVGAVFVFILIFGAIGLNLSMKTQARANENDDSGKVAGDFDIVEEEGTREGEIMEPDSDAQGSLYVPEVDRQVKESTKDVWGCTDPTAQNYNKKATSNDGSCKKSSSSMPSEFE